MRRVINATGVVLHTNLGRAPLGPLSHCRATPISNTISPPAAAASATFTRGSLLERLFGAPGIAVNNNAAAVFLALHELAAGGEAIVSRGELIEIGDGFRIPDIMARSGATLREVGTTNRTHIDDYRAAINDRTRLLLRVHPSNFRISGFTARPELRELAALGRERGIPVYEDLGSGCVVDLRAFGIDEPLVSDSLSAGADLVSFSGDKLLGGPQAGILAGTPELVARLRRNPLFRALRLDKLIYQALESTLRNLLLERWDAVPALAMMRQTADADSRAARQALRSARTGPARGSDRGAIGDRRRRHSGAVDSHLGDRRRLRQMWSTRERRLRAGDPPGGGAHRRRAPDLRLENRVPARKSRSADGLAAGGAALVAPTAATPVPGTCLRPC